MIYHFYFMGSKKLRYLHSPLMNGFCLFICLWVPLENSKLLQMCYLQVYAPYMSLIQWKRRVYLDTSIISILRLSGKHVHIRIFFFFLTLVENICLLHINQMGLTVENSSTTHVKIWLLFILFLCRGHNLRLLQIVFILKASDINLLPSDSGHLRCLFTEQIEKFRSK